MKLPRLRLLSAIALAITATTALRAGNGYANGNVDNSTSATWNDAGTSGSSLKWTSDGGATYVDATPGNDYHTNGYNVRAGRIGVKVTAGAPGTTTFFGDHLIIDGYDAASGVASSTANGLLQFDLASTSNNGQTNGPRQNPTDYYRGEYTANIVTAATPGLEVRTIRAGTGVATLHGTLVLNGKTRFDIPGSVNDVRFNIEAPVTGTGDIEIAGGSAGGGTANGFVTWAFRDLTGWQGSTISVINKHTISFTGPANFYVSNPNAALRFSSTSAGFLNLSADVSFASGKVSFTTGTTSNPITTVIPDGVYTVTDLNNLAQSVSGTNAYLTQPLASEGPGYPAPTSGTTFKLYIGQGIPSTAPTITAQPTSQRVLQGYPATFTVDATGSPTPTYQWKKNGADIPGATGSSYTVSSAVTGDAGDYTVAVTNIGGTVTSSVANLEVLTSPELPTITTHPASQTRYQGTSVTFTVDYTGGVPAPTFQWKKDGVDITDAVGKSYTINSVAAASAGAYTVVLHNAGGDVTSDAATLSVTPLPTDTHFYANAAAGNNDNWNSANAGIKWTHDSGQNYLAASATNTYHTNGYAVRAGHIGVVTPATPNTSTFSGQTLVIDSFSDASNLTNNSAGAGGTLNFELASSNVGPRLNPTAYTQGTYVANIVTAATAGGVSRTIRANNGSTTLEGTLVLNGDTVFSIPSNVSDVLFSIKAPVSGTGNIELSGGSAAGGTVNGYVTWAFHDLSNWQGSKITVTNKHTISFKNPTDFFRTNPNAELSFPAAAYLNLQADVSFGSGKVSFVTGNTSSGFNTTVVPDGIYTVASLNDYVATIQGTNPYTSGSPLASEGPTNVVTADSTGTTYKIYIGSGLPTVAPVFTTQPQDATVTAGASVTLTAAASGVPTPTYQWKKDGVEITGATNATLSFSSVQTTDAGTYSVVATNSAGTATSSDAVLTVNLPAAPSITTQPAAQSKLAGESATFNVVASSTVPVTYQWQKDGTDITGATNAALMIANVQSSDQGSYTVVVSNAGGSVASDAATLTVTASQARITTQPASQVVGSGSNVTLSVEAAGTAPLTYAWFKDGVAIAGATGNSLVLNNVQAADSGSYTVQITNSEGTVTSDAAILQVNEVSSTYLSNLSVRTTMSAQQNLIVGFVVNNGTKPVLLRAAGPALKATFDLDGFLPDPKLNLYNAGGTPLASNDDWNSSLASTFASLGAFPFVSGSKDAALLQSVTDANTAHAPAGASSGTQLVEVYDAGSNNGPKLVNVSARNFCGTGDNILIAGFVIAGEGKHTVLIRGIGPGLTHTFELKGVLADPKLTLYDADGNVVTSNDSWDSSLAPTFETLGAFELEPGSKDAALLVELDAGVYTAQVAGADGGTGEALVEIYDATP